MNDWAAMGNAQKGSGDSIIYYKRPNKGDDPGWIVYGDSISGSKLRDYVRRGFTPLMQFGAVNTRGRDLRAFGGKDSAAEDGLDSNKYIWEAILSHPDGPAMFPVDQVVAMRWYRPEKCPVPDAYFPQLVGLKLRELTCPERCGRLPFVEVEGAGGVSALRQHLRIMHEWDQANLQSYGERVGIDFNKADVGTLLIEEVSYGDAAETLTCEKCGEEFKGRMAAARKARHLNSHPVVELSTV